MKQEVRFQRDNNKCLLRQCQPMTSVLNDSFLLSDQDIGRFFSVDED